MDHGANTTGNVTSREADSSPAARLGARPGGAVLAAERPGAALHPLIESLVERLEPDALREAVAGIFGGLARLIDRLRLIEQVLEKGEPPARALLLFSLVHEKAASLLVHIQRQALKVDGLNDQLADVLDGTCFAVRHELRRAFETGMLVDDPSAPPGKLRADMARAHGLLLNCFQQSTIAIARVFDAGVTGVALFDDLKDRRRQSALLYEELTKILGLAQGAERECDLVSFFALEECLKEFRTGCMQYLMYRDWAEFEAFIEGVCAAKNAVELQQLLHRFARYLETLISHVGMRAALAEQAAD